MKYVIIGNGPAGMSAVKTILETEPKAQIIIIGDEEVPPYSRILITYYLEGKITKEKIFVYGEELLKSPRVKFKYPVKIVSIDVKNKYICSSEGERLNYDRLLIASGASPKLPSQPGMNSKCVYTIRNFSDIEEIHNKLDKIRDCVFLGGGMVSLKMVQAIKRRGVKVIVAVSGDHIISQRLDIEGAQLVTDYLKSKNIQIITNETAQAIIDYRDRKLIYFNSGKKLETDMVIIGKGVTPNYNFIDIKQIKVNQGIVVDNYFRTSAPDVFAAGDVIESKDLLSNKSHLNSILPNAVKQGRIVALNMIGIKCSYQGDIEMNSIQLFNLPIISIGLVNNQNKKFEEITHYNSYNNSYKRLLFDGDLLVGTIMIGDIKNAGIYHQVIENKKRIIEKKELLNNEFNLLKYIRISKEEDEYAN